jgi:hypothetical protein
MESLHVLETRTGTMNHLEKLRRSAMSIAANAPRPFIKLRRSGMFVRRFMESLHVLKTRIGTMNLCGAVFSLSPSDGERVG